MTSYDVLLSHSLWLTDLFPVTSIIYTNLNLYSQVYIIYNQTVASFALLRSNDVAAIALLQAVGQQGRLDCGHAQTGCGSHHHIKRLITHGKWKKCMSCREGCFQWLFQLFPMFPRFCHLAASPQYWHMLAHVGPRVGPNQPPQASPTYPFWTSVYRGIWTTLLNQQLNQLA